MSIETIINKIKDEIDLPADKVMGSNLIEPTEAMVKDVIQRYVFGEDIWTIRCNVKKKGTNLKLSEEQINTIISEYKKQTEVINDE